MAPPAVEVIEVPVIELNTIVWDAPYRYKRPPFPDDEDIDVNVDDVSNWIPLFELPYMLIKPPFPLAVIDERVDALMYA